MGSEGIPHSLKEELSDTLLAGYHDGHLIESINEHENAIISVLSRKKAQQVIHGDIFPRMTRSR